MLEPMVDPGPTRHGSHRRIALVRKQIDGSIDECLSHGSGPASLGHPAILDR
jgi:hypothetical protein